MDVLSWAMKSDDVDMSFGRVLTPLLIGALMLGACSGDDDQGGSETAATSETGDGECYDVSNEGMPVDPPTCGLPQPCAEAEWASDTCESAPVYDPAVGACILATLAAGEAAEVRLRDCPGGQFSSWILVQMFGDGTVQWERGTNQDQAGNRRATWRALPEPSYFEACSADTPEALTACLQGLAETTCQLGEPACPD